MSWQNICQERIRASDREWFLCVSGNYWFYSHDKKYCWADTCPTLKVHLWLFQSVVVEVDQWWGWLLIFGLSLLQLRARSQSQNSLQPNCQTFPTTNIWRWFCTVSMQWCMGWPQLVPASSFERASQSSRIQARFLLKMKMPPNHLHLLLLIQIVIYIVHIPWSNLSKVVVHFPDLGLSDSWTIVQLKELFRWVFSSKRFCRQLSEWNAKFSFWKWNTE